MNRVVLAALAAILLVLAGCLQPAPGAADDAPAASPDADGAAVAMDVALTGCVVHEVIAAVDAAAARGHVPEDFDVALDETGRAVAALGGFECGEDGALAKRGFLLIKVEPGDDALLAEGVGNYFWTAEHVLVHGSALTTAFLEVGADAILAADVEASTGPAEIALVIDAGDWRHRASGVPGTRPVNDAASFLGHFREYAAADGGYAYLDAAFHGEPETAAGVSIATVETGAGTVTRGLLGDASILPVLSLDSASYANARVGFVPRAS